MRPNFVMKISVKDFDGKEGYVNDYDSKITTRNYRDYELW